MRFFLSSSILLFSYQVFSSSIKDIEIGNQFHLTCGFSDFYMNYQVDVDKKQIFHISSEYPNSQSEKLREIGLYEKILEWKYPTVITVHHYPKYGDEYDLIDVKYFNLRDNVYRSISLDSKEPYVQSYDCLKNHP